MAAREAIAARHQHRFAGRAALLAGCSLVCTLGCTVGPRYKRPTAQVPDTWKGEGPWQAAAPKDAIPKGAWWQIFHDAELDRLEQELLQANQSLAAAQDRLLQARAQARIASSAYFPGAQRRSQRAANALLRQPSA
jgi:outer membrane protein, multidrug efflux system